MSPAPVSALNLLFLTPQLPYPPRQGTAIRNWGLIKHLAQRHALTLLSFAEPESEAVAPELRAACRRIITVPLPHRTRADRLRTLGSPHADLSRRLWSPGFAQIFLQLLQETAFDFVHLEGLELAPYLFVAPRPGPRFLYDAHNAEYLIQARAWLTDLRLPRRWPAAGYSALQIPRLQAFEARVCRAAAAVTCVSAEDAAALQKLVPGLQPTVVPNGITLADYARPPAGARFPARLIFTGKMDYRPNLDAARWFITAIWPRLRAACPPAEFFIVGQKPPAALWQWNGREGIRVTGAVADVRPYIAEAAVYVAPLRMGGGTRFKLLEAMALACPIVSTSIGAEGFAIQTGRELVLADTPAAFADAGLALLNDPARAAALGQAGRQFVEQAYDWEMIIPRLEAVYTEKHAGR